MVCAWVPTLVPTWLCVTLLVSECQNCLPQKCRFLLLFIFLYLFLPPPFSIGRDFWRVHYFTFGKGHLRGQQWLCSSWISYLRDQLFGKVIFGRKIPNICVTYYFGEAMLVKENTCKWETCAQELVSTCRTPKQHTGNGDFHNHCISHELCGIFQIDNLSKTGIHGIWCLLSQSLRSR